MSKLVGSVIDDDHPRTIKSEEDLQSASGFALGVPRDGRDRRSDSLKRHDNQKEFNNIVGEVERLNLKPKRASDTQSQIADASCEMLGFSGTRKETKHRSVGVHSPK